MRNMLRQHHISFRNAFSGLKWALITQPNFRVHIAMSLVAISFGWILELNSFEWLVLILTIFLALAAEMINTSFEALTDLVTSEWRKEAKIAKDVAAGMMLVVALASIVIGGMLFLPKLIIKLNSSYQLWY